MLYDPKWEVETKPDILSLEGVIAWLENQPANRAYNFSDCRGECGYALYMKAHGISWRESGGCGGGTSEDRQAREDFCLLAYNEVFSCLPWTFGAALERASEALGK